MEQQSLAKPIPKNPYMSMNPIRDRESLQMFYGRKLQLQRFYRDLAIRQSVSIRGPRQTGKTSFLWCACQPEVQARFDEDLRRHLFVLLDLRETFFQTVEGFFTHVSEAIARQARAQDLMLRPVGESADLYLSVLTQVSDQGYKLVLLLDSFDALARNEQFGPDFLSFLRSQSSNGNVTYVTASIEPLHKLGHRGIKDSPFFNVFDEIVLAELTREEAEQLIREPAQREGLPFTNEEVELVIKFAGLHPSFILRASAVLFDEKLFSINGRASEDHFRTRAYNVLLPHFQDIWERLSEQDRLLIRNETQQKKYAERGQKQTDDELEVVNNHPFSELSESAFFRQFVSEVNKFDLLQMDIEGLEEVLKKVQDLAALGETSLKLMKVVEHRINGNTLPTPIERGKVIREVLCEAFELLQGSEPRTDNDPGWLSYNILDYRYFSRYRYKHRDIAARLNFPNQRQYFRKHQEAIKLLLNALREFDELE